MRPRRNVTRWQHLAGRVIFPAAFPNGVIIDQDGYPVLDATGNSILPSYEPLPDMDVPVVDPSLYHTLDPEERAEQRVLQDHLRTIRANRLGHGSILEDDEYQPVPEDEISSSSSDDSDAPTSSESDMSDSLSMNALDNELDDLLSEDDDDPFSDFEDLDDPIEKTEY